jgi:chaperonin GroEL (HSP60 family)
VTDSGATLPELREELAAITGRSKSDRAGVLDTGERGDGTVDRKISGDEARDYTREATAVIASLVRSTFGPDALEKLVETEDPQGDPEVVLSGDAGEILDAIELGSAFAHPVAAMFVDYVDSMQRGLDDGTTAAILLAEALVDEGVDLVEDGLHPGTVAVGYAAATNRAGAVLDELARPVEGTTESLAAVARTTMTATLPDETADAYAALVAEAVARLRDEGDGELLDADDVKVLSAEKDALVPGVVVTQEASGLEAVEETKHVPDREFDPEPVFDSPIEDAGVAVVDRETDPEETATPLGGDHIDDTGVPLHSPEQVAEYASQVEAELDEHAARLANLGVEVLVSQPEQDESVRTAFERRGIRVVDDVTAPLADVYRIARLTDATVVSDLSNVSEDAVGRADSVTQRRVGEERWTTFEREDGPCSTVLLGPGADTGVDRRTRLVEDALSATAMAVMDDQLLPGGCAPAVAVASDLRDYATTLGDREQLAVAAFADALERLPYALAENAGQDPVDALARLRAAHSRAGERPAPLGLDVETGTPTDAWESGVVEPRRVFSQAVETANAVAEHLLTVDTVVFSGFDTEEHRPRTERD